MEDLEKEYPKPILIEDLGRIYVTENSKQKARYGIYKCGFCGTNFKANTNLIKRKGIKSCGCYKKRRTIEATKTHGLSNTRLNRIWRSIKDRTLNTNHKAYQYYGGRGITMCEEWKNDAKAFYDWAMTNGYEENKGLSIDRIDNDRGYSPENCRWTTKTIQMRNQRIRKDNTSGYKGVSYYKKANKYVVHIRVNSKKIHLGYFKTAIEAGVAYNNYIIENNLEGFNLNEVLKPIKK